VIPRHFQITVALLLLAILAAGMYIVRLKRREEAKSSQNPLAAPVAPPATGKQERIRVLVAYDDDLALRWRETQTLLPAEPGLRARAILRAALSQYLQQPSPHPLAKGADIKEAYVLGDGTVVIDTTQQFADGHPPGILLEELTVTSLVETLAANVPGVSRVRFLVDGHERETLAGHVDLMSFYQTATVHELAKEFE
jgi:hypothetical protein